MEHYRRTAHTRFDLKYHFVWITKYRKKLLRADVGVRSAAVGAGHLLGAGGRDPQGARQQGPRPPVRVVPAARLAELPDAADQGEVVAEAAAAVQPPEQGVLGPSPVGPGVLRGEFGEVITDEVIMEYIRTQDVTKEDGDFRVDDE